MIAETNRQLDELARNLPDRFKDKNGDVIWRDQFRFEIAGKADEYNALYRRLSASAHGRISDMLDGIMVGDDIHWPPAKPTEPPLVAVDCLCAILLESCGRIAKAYNKPDAPLKALARKRDKLRRLGRLDANVITILRISTMKTPICPTCSCSLVRLKISKDKAATSRYEGEEYHFCCQGCVDIFVDDPQKYLQEINDFIVCPTCLAEKPRHLAVKEEIAGREVYFCRYPHCIDAFRERPDHYINRLLGV